MIQLPRQKLPGEEKADAAVVENSASLTDKANIDNTVERDSITIGWQDATTLAPWGTNNDTPGNYEVYEMLYECTSNGERYGVLADESKGDFEPDVTMRTEPESTLYIFMITL